jgi:hypothetical protein
MLSVDNVSKVYQARQVFRKMSGNVNLKLQRAKASVSCRAMVQRNGP